MMMFAVEAVDLPVMCYKTTRWQAGGYKQETDFLLSFLLVSTGVLLRLVVTSAGNYDLSVMCRVLAVHLQCV